MTVPFATSDAWIQAEVHHDEVDGVAEAVREDRREEIAAGRDVEDAEEHAADRRLDHAGRPLVEMREAEDDVHDDERHDPRPHAGAGELRHPRQRVAAPDHLLAECGEHPVEREVDREQRRVADQVVEIGQVRPVAEQPMQQRHREEELEQPHGDADGYADRGEPRPAIRQPEADVAPAQAAKPQ